MTTATELAMSLDERMSLQHFLLMFEPSLSVDGAIGPATRTAIGKAQVAAKNRGLYSGAIDGQVGPLTRAAFNALGWNTPHETQVVVHPFPVCPASLKPLTVAQKLTRFGTPLTPDGKLIPEFQKRVVRVKTPQLANVGFPQVDWHADRADQLVLLLQTIEKEGLLKQILSCAGTWSPRFVRGSTTTFSSHAWGIAIDINAPQNWLGQTPAKSGQVGCVYEIVEIAKSLGGWYWGGWFTRLDGMHFEVAS